MIGGASDPHPYCAVAVTIIPLDADGKPVPARTVTLSGVGGPIVIEARELTITWVREEHTGTRFTVNGAREWI